MKKFIAIIVLLLITMSLFACSSKNSYIDFAFDYFEDANIKISHYNIEKYKAVNINIDDSKCFDEGRVYRITIYEKNSLVREKQYFVGKLNGKKILYRYEENGLYSKLVEVKSE